MNNLPLLRRLALVASIVIVTLLAAGLSASARTLLERGERSGVALPAPDFPKAADLCLSR